MQHSEFTLKEVQNYYKQIINDNHKKILDKWMESIEKKVPLIIACIDTNILRNQSDKFLETYLVLLDMNISLNFNNLEYEPIKNILTEICTFYAKKGISAELTAGYIFSLKDTLIETIEEEIHKYSNLSHSAMLLSKDLLEPMALYTYKIFVNAREEIIKQQAMAIAELSTPVIQLWDSVLALPLIGTVDSARAKQIMENLLNEIVKSKSSQVIIDITGVPVVDTGVADRLMRTVEAARLLGADCILTGISPAIAQTLVLVGIDLSGIQTRATLKNGLELALQNLNIKIIEK